MTRPYAEVIGDPIAHSKSPLIHNFWLGKLGIDAEYRACHVKPDELADYFAQRREDAAWRGCNVTLPHKSSAISFADRVDDVAQAIGASNCIFRDEEGKFIATNTDVAGFLLPIKFSELAGKHAVVIGAGGAARAVLVGLKQLDIGFVTVLNRSIDKATALLTELRVIGEAMPLGNALPESCALLVNASSLGMAGHNPLALDLSPLSESAEIYDIVYSPLETVLLRDARERHLRAIDGLMMLVGQASRAFEMFYSAPPQQLDPELLELLTA